MTNRMPFISLGLLIIGFAGGYALRGAWISFPLYHLGGLASLSLLACASGALARRKGRGYWRAYSITLILSAVLGIIAAYVWPTSGEEGRPATCGGSVSLVIALIAIVYWAVVKRKEKEEA